VKRWYERFRPLVEHLAEPLDAMADTEPTAS
jgi:hypothetical protein